MFDDMDTELLVSLFSNLALTAVLFTFAKWYIGYDMRWWLRLKRGETAYKTMRDFVYLKIKLPKEVFKTPAAMEVVLLTLNQGLGHAPFNVIPKIEFTPFYKKDGKKNKFSWRLFTYYGNSGKEIGPRYKWIQQIKKNWQDKYLKGGLRSWSSLEIISEEGNIYFLVVTKTNNKDLFRQAAYSQFPGIEIEELKEDPLNKFHYTNQKTGESNLYVGRYKLKKDDHMPIKTYVDYGLDKDMVKDEFKIDPLVVLLEGMAQAQKGEMYWLQFTIRPTIYNADDDLSEHPYHWQKKTEEEINRITAYEKKTIEVDDGHGGKKKQEVANMGRGLLSLTLTEKQQVEAMQRNIEKPGFDVVMKMYYWVDKKVHPKGFDADKVAKGVMTVVYGTKQFEKPGFNGFGFETLTIDSDYPALDPTGEWSEGMRGFFWKIGKLRAAFYQETPGVEFAWKFFPLIWSKWKRTGNWDSVAGLWGEIKEYWLHPGEYPHWSNGAGHSHQQGFILNLEELATVWHFPGKVFGNVESKVAAVKADPPSNLPI